MSAQRGKRTTDPAILSLGDRIAAARIARTMTQRELAIRAFPKKLVTTQASKISYWEKGEFIPSLEAVRALARALAVTTDWLLAMPEAQPTKRKRRAA